MDLPSIVHRGGPSLEKPQQQPQQHYHKEVPMYGNEQGHGPHSASSSGALPGPPAYQANFGALQYRGNEENFGYASNDDKETKTKKTRKRQQVSCISCHKRKQKCNKEVPCERCIKRGDSDSCRIMDASEKDSNPASAADGMDAKKRKRHSPGQEGESDLAERVRQLEHIISLSQLAGNAAAQRQPTDTQYRQPDPTHYQPSDPTQYPLPDLPRPSDNGGPERSDSSGTEAVEEAAVAALSTLSRSVPTEGGSEVRIYSGPGSVKSFLEASGFGSNSDPGFKETRIRPSDLVLYEDSQKMANPSLRLSKLADALKEHKSKLPPSAICHHLFNFYHSCPLFKDRMRVFPRGSYQMEYDALFDASELDVCPDAQKARAQKFPQLASHHSLAFISMLFAIFAIYTHALASVMYENSRGAFLASERREQASYSCIMTLISQSVWLKISGCPSVGFTFVSSAIRFAQILGMHREPGVEWGIGGFEAEVRKRIWWQLVFIDKMHSISYGRPPTIAARHCDVQMPSNIYSKDLTAEGAVNIRPDSEVTEMTISRLQCSFAAVLSEIVDRALSCQVPTYSTILELDTMLTNFELHIPKAFKDPSLVDMVEKSYLAGDLAGFQLTFSWNRSLLHRPYLLRPLPKAGEPDHFAGSRAVTIMLSKRMISINKDQVAQTALNLQAYFGYAFNAFEPAVNLSMAILQDPLGSQVTALDTYVQQAMQLLESMISVNRVAGEGLQSLAAMRTRYLQVVADTRAQTNHSPSVSTTSGSNPSPSLYTSLGPSPVSTTTSSTSAAEQTLAASQIPSDNTATPNTLFNQFFAQNGPVTIAVQEDAAKVDVQDTIDIDQLFNFDPSMYNNDPSASWLTDPMVGGLEAWPDSFHRLEGESDFGDWKQKLGF